jgi:hypothetical protein
MVSPIRGRCAVAVVSNSEEILERNLKRSPLLQSGDVPLHVETGAPSAAIAYNRALDATDTEFVIFAHQDVYLPQGWDAVLEARLTELAARDPGWALVGAFGVDLHEKGFGVVWSTSLGNVVGRLPYEPVQVQSYDEFLIVMRRTPGLRFDERLPGFHLYGTDIVQTAWAMNLGCYVMALPTVHNDRYHEELGVDFHQAYRYMQRKWRDRLPLATPVVKISWHGLHLRRTRKQAKQSRDYRRAMALPNDVDPMCYASLCGWSQLSTD